MSRKKTVTFARGTHPQEAVRKRSANELDGSDSFSDIDTTTRFGRNRESQDVGLRESELLYAPAESLVHEENPGFHVTAFNLDDELNEGSIDDDAGFIPTSLQDRAITSPENSQSSSDLDADADQRESIAQEEEDEWADDTNEQHGTAPAYQAPTTYTDDRPPPKRQRTPEVGDSASSPSLQTDFTAELCELLLANETAMGAIRRLKGVGKMGELERVTELCDGLLGSGVLGIYEMDREALLNRVQWTLAWGLEGGCNDLHGPFDTSQMVEWSTSGFFSYPGKVGWVRVVGANRPWLLASDVFGPYKVANAKAVL